MYNGTTQQTGQRVSLTRMTIAAEVRIAGLLALLVIPSTATADPNAPALAPGGARPWQSEMQVSTYSAANLHDGSLSTRIHFLSWTGRGPGISVGIVHDSADVNDWSSTYPTHGPSGGFNLGPGWRHSYGGRVVGDPNDPTVTVIEDDGTQNVFTYDAGSYDAPAGIFDTLEAAGGGWKLIRKNQITREFDGDGRLTSVSDAGENTVTIARDVNDRIDYVEDATGLAARRIHFSYYDDPNDPTHAQGRLRSISHTIVEEDPDRVRTWTFQYDPNDAQLDKVIFPSNDPNDPINIPFGYDANGRLTAVSDKEGNTYAYSYHPSGDNAGRLHSVTDPSPFTGQMQTFDYEWVQEGNPSEDRWLTTVTDRGGEDWEYAFTTSGELRRETNPLSETTTYAAYDSDHNVEEKTNERGNTWTYDYDSNGNLLDVTDPNNDVVSRQYDSYNNLTHVENQAGAVTQHFFNDPNTPNLPDPTLRVMTTFPADGEGNPAVDVLYEYWGQDEDEPSDNGYAADAWNGKLRSVTTENDVVISYEYDGYGQFRQEIDGDTDGKFATLTNVEFNSEGQPDGASGGMQCPDGGDLVGCGEGCASIVHDMEGNIEAVNCIACVYVCECLGFLTTPAGGCDAPNYLPGNVSDGGSVAQYDRMGRMTFQSRFLSEFEPLEYAPFSGYSTFPAERTTIVEYDELGRVTSRTIESTEPGTWSLLDPNDIPVELVERTFTFDYSDRWTDGKVYRTAPDSSVATTTYDAAGRVSNIAIGPDPNTVEQSVSYSYYAGGLPHVVTNGNGTTITYEYDDADRVTQILHEENTTLIKRLDYHYLSDGRPLIYQIEEYNDGTGKDVVTFTYDDRDRLIHESRLFVYGMFATPIYDYAYTYDQGGNRRTFADSLNNITHQYFYDVHEFDPNDIVPDTRSNRLLWYDVLVDGALTETVHYSYNTATGNPTSMIRIPKIDPNEVGVASGTYLRYNGAQQLRIIAQQQWDVDYTGAPVDCNDVAVTLIREYRYDAARQRYLEREWQPREFPLDDWQHRLYRGREFAGTGTVTLNWADAQSEAESYNGHLATVETPAEWGLMHDFWTLGGSVYLGGYQDVNAPDYGEPLGGWTWVDDERFAPWCDPNVVGAGNPPWDYHEEEDPPPGRDPNEPQYETTITIQPDNVPSGVNYLKMNFASGQPYNEGNWYDSNGQGQEGYIIERPLFVKDRWSDYAGNAIVADWTVDLTHLDPNTGALVPEAVPIRRYLAGVSFVDVSDPNAPVTRYFHNNHLGTTQAMSDANGDRTDLMFYSAFGVQVGHDGSTATRYGYVGAEGYQTDAATGFMHLGARYYDPTIGRFLQRDPIGIRGGRNTYLYATANSPNKIDSNGLHTHDSRTFMIMHNEKEQSEPDYGSWGRPYTLNDLFVDATAWADWEVTERVARKTRAGAAGALTSLGKTAIQNPAALSHPGSIAWTCVWGFIWGVHADNLAEASGFPPIVPGI